MHPLPRRRSRARVWSRSLPPPSRTGTRTRAGWATRRPGAERGASAIEYALLVAAVAAVIVAVVFGFASIVKDAFSTTTDCVTGGGTSTSCPSSSN